MNNIVRWVLIVSIFVALVIMLVAWIWMRRKTKKIKNQYAKDESQYHDPEKIKTIEERGDDHGVLLWDLKKETKRPLDDFQLEFIINSLFRNSFKRTYVVNEDNYVLTSLKKIAKQKVDKKTPQSIIINNSESLNDEFDKYFKLLAEGGLMFITNASGKEVKKLLSYTKLSGIRREQYKKIGKGIVLIAK